MPVWRHLPMAENSGKKTVLGRIRPSHHYQQRMLCDRIWGRWMPNTYQGTRSSETRVMFEAMRRRGGRRMRPRSAARRRASARSCTRRCIGSHGESREVELISRTIDGRGGVLPCTTCSLYGFHSLLTTCRLLVFSSKSSHHRPCFVGNTRGTITKLLCPKKHKGTKHDRNRRE